MDKVGKELITSLLKNIPTLPGIYKMISKIQEILYIGKAKNLRNRVSHYSNENLGSTRLELMVSQICKIDYITVSSEEEALILEANLIREYKPKYNILFKDDKSFPYIKIATDHEFPQLAKYRGKNLADQKLYGPFSSISYLNSVFATLQKIFQLRNCTDRYFSSRKRPCIQYEIKRCSAPCVKYISMQGYSDTVRQTRLFLEGKTSLLQTMLSQEMQTYSDNLDYEKAAIIRDRIKAINSIQQQSNHSFVVGDSDIIGVATQENHHCIVVFSYRGGQNYGSKIYFPVNTEDSTKEEVITNFISVFYQNRIPPSKIWIPVTIQGKEILEKALIKMHKTSSKIIFDEDNELLQNANCNALTSLRQKIDKTIKHKDIFSEIGMLFGIKKEIKRIEVYDNSHIFGQHAVGAMVAANSEGIIKSECRAYTLEGLILKMHGGDDYEMLRQVLNKRFGSKNLTQKPDLIIIDGGKGHLNAAKSVISQYCNESVVVSMAKGPERNAGKETFFTEGKEQFSLPHNDKVMHYLQRLRDEVHNLAISAYRKKHQKAMYQSTLSTIDGIGKSKNQLLLNHFGSIQNATKASISELSRVKGIGEKTAIKIHQALQNFHTKT
jgi:excinuclease ABC subunit C